MTITAERPVTFPDMTDQPIAAGALTRAAVAELLGVSPNTISFNLSASAEGGRYEDNPFPKPDDYFGGRPWWRPERANEFTEWAARRKGPGVGGGQPSHQRNRR